MKNIFKIFKINFVAALALMCCTTLANAQSCSDDSSNWTDISALFSSNGCSTAGCHGGNAGGLNLTTYANFLNGGSKCNGDITTGTTLADIINVGGVVCASGTVFSSMNTFTGGTVDAAELVILQTWIDAGIPETCPIVPSVCTDIVVDAQPVCSGVEGQFDIQINAITGGDDLGDLTGTYTVSDGTNTITFPTQTTLTGLAYTNQNDKITLTITDVDDVTCSTTYDVLQLECLPATTCDCSNPSDPFSIDAQASGNGNGYSMVYVLTDNAGTVIAVNQTGSFGPFADDGATYNAYAYNVLDTELTAFEADLNTLLGSSVEPSLTVNNSAPFNTYCYTEVTAAFTENCDCCPTAATVDIFAPVFTCSGALLSTDITDWQGLVTDANPLDATQDPFGLATIVYSDAPAVQGTTPPNGNLPDGVHPDETACDPFDQFAYAYLVCDLGTPDTADDTYQLISQLTVTIYPTGNIAPPTGDACSYTPTTACGNITLEYDTGAGFTATAPSLNPGDADQAVNWQAVYTDGTVCSTGQYTLTCSLDCPDVEIVIDNPVICTEDATAFVLSELEPMGFMGGVWTDAVGATVTMPDIADGDTFTYTYTDENGCVYSTTITFTVNEGVGVAVDVVLCDDPANANYDLTPFEPAGTTGTWDGIADPTNVDASQGGGYTYNYADENGCQSFVDVGVFVPTPIEFTLEDLGICEGETGVLAPVGLTPGNYNYAWSDGSVTSSINVNMAGTYSVTISDEFGCVATAEALVTVGALTVDIGGQAICAGEATAYDLTQLEPAGQMGGTWQESTTGATATTVDINDGDIFVYTYTDESGCAGMDTIAFSISSDLQITAAPTCTAANEGEFYINILEVTGDNQTDYTVEAGGLSVNYTGTAVVLGPFPYTDHNAGITVTATSSTGCTATLDVLQLECLPQTTCNCENDITPFNINTQAAANGDGYSMVYALTSMSTGFVIGVNVDGSFQSLVDNTDYMVYAFNVEDVDLAAFTADLNALTTLVAGDAILTGDAPFDTYCYVSASQMFTADCMCETTVDCSDLPELVVEALPTCTSSMEGEFYIDILNVTGGTMGTDYTVTAGGLSVTYPATTVIGPLTYTDHNADITVTATSAEGCTGTTDVLQLNCAPQEVCDCDAAPTPYTINAQGAGNANDASMLYVLVNNDDSNNIVATNDNGTFTPLVDTTNYTVYAFNIDDADLAAFTAALGALTSISAGDAILSEGNAAPFEDLCYVYASQMYYEDCGCIDCTDFAVGGTVTDVTCSGLSDGAIDLTVSGGDTPYTYAWSNGADTEDLSDLQGGNYDVTVADAKGCTTELTFVVNENAAVVIDDIAVVELTCTTDGSITVTASGGTAPYTFGIDELSLTQASNAFTNLDAGTYTITVTDTNGCIASQIVTLTAPALPTADVVVTQTPTCGETDGIATVTPTSGTAPFTYEWSDGQTTATATGLGAGTYTVEVTDADGCATELSVSLISDDCGFDILTYFAQDGCTCNNDQSENGAGDGTFEETVTVLAPAGLIIRADVTSTGILEPVNLGFGTNTLPIEFFETAPGRYILVFQHQDRVGYVINVEYSFDGGMTFIPAPNNTGGQLSYSNVCAYPVLVFNPILDPYCTDGNPFELSVVETSTNVDFVAEQGYPSVSVNSSPQVPSPITVDPEEIGNATYTFSGFYDYESGPGTGGTLENPAVSINQCETFIRVNVPINYAPVGIQTTCAPFVNPNEYRIEVDPSAYGNAANLMYRLNNGAYQTSNEFIVNGEGDYTVGVMDMVTNCTYETGVECLRTVLPIELTSFVGACEGGETKLTWTTATEENVSHFVIERASNGSDFVEIGSVAAVGNTTTPQSYGYIDRTSITRQYYYRLRAVEFDGVESTSRVELVECLQGSFGVVDVYPNPTEAEVAISFEVNDRDVVNIRLTDVLGRTIHHELFTPEIGINNTVINMSNLAPAMYIIVLDNGTQQSIEKVVKK